MIVFLLEYGELRHRERISGRYTYLQHQHLARWALVLDVWAMDQ